MEPDVLALHLKRIVCKCKRKTQSSKLQAEFVIDGIQKTIEVIIVKCQICNGSITIPWNKISKVVIAPESSVEKQNPKPPKDQPPRAYPYNYNDLKFLKALKISLFPPDEEGPEGAD